MQFARAVRSIASACLVSMLAACGGGGGGDEDPTSTITLETPTSSTAAGTFTTQKHNKYTESTGTVLGDATTIDFQFSNGTEAGVSYINSDTSIYIVGFSDASGYYACGSATATSAIGIMTCPSNIQVDLGRKMVKFTSAEMEELDAMQPNIRVTGELRWD